MPTLDDLHAAFSELERQAPVALSEPVRPSHRRRWAAIGLAAACTATVAVAVPLLTRSGGAPAPRPAASPETLTTTADVAHPFTGALPAPADGRSPDLAYGFAVPGTVAGYTVIPDLVTRSYQHASIYGPTEPPGGQVFVFYRGAFDESSLSDRVGVDVDGRQGYFADVRLPGDDTSTEALVWSYADEGWAAVRLGVAFGNPVVKGSGVSASERANAESQVRSAYVHRNELELATAMVPADGALRSPVRIVDPGLHVDSISSGGPDGALDLSGPAADWSLGWSPGGLHPSDKSNAGTVTLGSHEWIVYTSGGAPSSLGLVTSGWGLTVTPGGAASLDQMKQFAATLQLAPDPLNTDTWFDAGANLP